MKLYKVKNRESEGYHWRGHIFGLTNTISGDNPSVVRSKVYGEATRNVVSGLATFAMGAFVLAGLYAVLTGYFLLLTSPVWIFGSQV